MAITKPSEEDLQAVKMYSSISAAGCRIWNPMLPKFNPGVARTSVTIETYVSTLFPGVRIWDHNKE